VPCVHVPARVVPDCSMVSVMGESLRGPRHVPATCVTEGAVGPLQAAAKRTRLMTRAIWALRMLGIIACLALPVVTQAGEQEGKAPAAQEYPSHTFIRTADDVEQVQGLVEPGGDAPPTQAELQARSDAELLRLEVERLARRVAELEGLVAALSRPTIERLSQERQQLEQDLHRAGYTRDAQGRVTRRTEPETPPAPPTKEP
jgi:hypothetical protein